MRVGLTGGIGSGKSAVAALFSAWGAAVIDYDVLARDVVAPGTPGLAAIASRWPHVVDARGVLDRAALGRLVFADASAREALGAIVHPRVRAKAAALEAHLEPDRLVVHVVPLLFEGDAWRTFDRTAVVTAPLDQRIARVRARDGLTADAIAARIAAQIDPREAVALADVEIVNDAGLDALETNARRVFDAWSAPRSQAGASAERGRR